MTALARRAFIAGTAAVASPVAAIAATSPDAELVKLGQEFARAFDSWRQAHAVWRIAHRDACSALAPHGTLGADAKWLADFSRAYDATPARLASDKNEEALNRCDALAVQIRAVRPTTLQGLAAHAKIARFEGVALADLDTPRKDLNHEVATIIDFLDLVEALAS